jgi:AraC-like DNA-binding protein
MIETLLSQLDNPFTGEQLFDYLSDIVFFIKDEHGRYLVVNNTLVQRCGLRDKQQLIGKTPSEVLRPPLGDSFQAQDQATLKTGQPLLCQLELHIYPSREVGWCLTTKLPLRNRRGQTIGLVGVSQDLRLPDMDAAEYQALAAVIAYAESNIATAPTISTLAKIASMSRYQLDRRMQRVFGLTTSQWLLKMRIDRAQQQLVSTNQSIADIALSVGYADQSAFTRQFHHMTGMSPRDYRASCTVHRSPPQEDMA